MNNESMYVRLQHELLKLIQQREFKQGSRFPSERELSLKFSTSRVTIRKAIEGLVQMGVLERRGTSGTYLPEKLFDRPLNGYAAYSISDVVEKSGHIPGSKLLYFERKKASLRLSEKLNIAVDDPVIAIQRLRTVDGIPVCLEQSEISARLVPGLTAADIIENKSLYEHVRNKYLYELKNKSANISIHKTSEAEAELLCLPAGSAVLKFAAVSVTSDGTPFEHLCSFNHPDYVSFSVATRDSKPSFTVSPVTLVVNNVV